MPKKLSLDDAPGIIYEDVYYFEKLKLKKGFFTLGVWKGEVVRADARLKSLLGQSINEVIKIYEQRNYEIHKV